MATLVPVGDIRKIAIVGTGTIGSGWAAVFKARGYEVKAFVRSEASATKFRSFLQVSWRKVMARGLADDPDGWKGVECVQDLSECVRDADYVQESVVEELNLKQGIVAQIDALAQPHVLIGSSSSFIPLSMVRAQARLYPERVATVHPTLPQWDDFVEVLGSCNAYTQWLASLFGRAHVGMDVITLQKEMHGHAHNMVLNCVLSASTALVQSGVTSAEEMDRAICHMSRLVLASGGISGALVGVVGNGSVDAQTGLAADVLLGAPAAIGACVASWILPAFLARICLYMLRVTASLYTGSATVKRLAKRYIRYACGPFHEQWRADPCGGLNPTEFEQRGLRRMNVLAKIE